MPIVSAEAQPANKEAKSRSRNLAVWAMNLVVLQVQWDLRTMGQHEYHRRRLWLESSSFSPHGHSASSIDTRVLMYSAAGDPACSVQQVAGALREGKLDEAISIAERNKKSHIAKVVATGLSEFQSATS